MKNLSTIPRMQRLFVAVFLFSLMSATSFAQTVLFRDDFNGAMQSGWTWTRENPATWSLTSTGLQIELEYGDLWQNWTNNCQNMLLRPAPSSDFIIEAKLDVSLVAPINQAHILLYYNDDYYVRFGPVLSYGYQVVIDVVHEVGGGIAHQSAVSWGSNLVYLKIQKSGSSASCYYSSDGQNWTLHHTISDLNFPVDQVGLVAFDGSEPPSSSVATYDYFQISEPAPCVTPPSGLVSWWPGDGNANDIQSSNHGTLQNGATFAAGKVDQALSFDGVDDYVDLGNNSSLNIPGSLTISAWVLIQSFPPNQDYFIADFDVSGYVSQGSLGVLPQGILLTQHFFWTQRTTDNTSQPIIGATVLSTNRWYHVAGVRDDNTKTVKLYVDGSEDGNGNYAGKTIVNLQRNKLLGRSGPEFGDYFHGFLDEVSIYNRALFASEIQSIYNAGSAGKCKECTPPEVNITGDDPVCPHSFHTYAATTNATNTSFNWSVTGGTIYGSNTGSSINVIAGSAGTMIVSVEVTDGATNCTNSATQNVTVEDNQPPVVTVGAGPIVLWPPNHKYVTLDTITCGVSATDNCAGISVNDVFISKVTSDEPEDAKGNGDGNTLNDIVIARDCKSVQLRREREGSGNGRVYTIYWSAKDRSGNIGTATCLVTVPHDQNGAPAVDNGPVYTVNGSCNGSSGKFGSLSSNENAETMTLPESYALEQNFPNPFNPSTVISFQLPVNSEVKIAVYSLTGQLVRELVNGEMNAGRHALSWDGHDRIGNTVAAGMYLYRLVAHGENGEVVFTQTRRMAFVK